MVLKVSGELVEVVGHDAGVGFGRWVEGLLDAEVEFEGVGFEPDTASGCQWWRLGDFGESEDLTVELSASWFAIFGDGELDVINSCEFHRYRIRGAKKVLQLFHSE